MSPSRRRPATPRSTRDHTERERAEQLQAATYRISEAAHAAEDLPELFRAIHGIISELMPAKNLYIALYDADSGLLSFPYWVEEHDPPPAPHKRERGDGPGRRPRGAAACRPDRSLGDRRGDARDGGARARPAPHRPAAGSQGAVFVEIHRRC